MVWLLGFAVAILALQLGLRWSGPASLAGVAADFGPSALVTPASTAALQGASQPPPGRHDRAFANARTAMGRAAQASSHPSMPWLATPAGGQFSSFMPSDRPRWASTSLISVSDFLPRFGVLSSSTSVFWIRSPM